MLIKFWKQLIVLLVAFISFIAGIYGDEIKILLPAVEIITFFVKNKIFYVLGIILLFITLFLFLLDKYKSLEKSSKKNKKQQKFEKQVKRRISLDDGTVITFDIFYDIHGTPSSCNIIVTQANMIPEKHLENRFINVNGKMFTIKQFVDGILLEEWLNLNV